MEAIVRPFFSWDEWPEATREFFKAQRTPAGEELILQKNLFIEYFLPLRGMSKDAMEVYRRYYRNPGPSRQPILTRSRELPIELARTQGRGQDRGFILALACQQLDSQIVHQWGSRCVSDRPAKRILPNVVQSTRSYG